MAKNVLIATLGESPIVVTSMVKALQEKKELKIDQLDVIHPKGEKLIDLGYDMVTEHLQGTCAVAQCILPFPDTNSRETSMEFLQILSDLIQNHEHAENNVYLSLAGGRKNMSALMALTCQFFGCVCGLYHILDKYENDSTRRNFHSIEALCDFGEEERYEKLSPPAENLILVEIPYQQLSSGVALRQYFSEAQVNPNLPTFIEIDGELDAFYREIFQKKKTDFLDVYLSEEAYEFYTKKRERRKYLKNCFRSMQNPQTLGIHNHSLSSPKTDCHCFKMGNTDERLFYYKTDSGIIIATIVTHGKRYERIANGNEPLYRRDHLAYIHSSKLEKDSILIAPLGKSPMVATQTFALISTREDANIKKIIVVHPKNPEIRNGVKLLKDVFKQKGKPREFVESIQIENIQDVASNDDCRIYLERLVSEITKVQRNGPDTSIHLSLSGGRKGMAALTLFAAQQANIDVVYHTLITDIDVEKKIEEETTLDALGQLTRFERVQRLFLDDYDESKFELFRVPVIPISIGSTKTL